MEERQFVVLYKVESLSDIYQTYVLKPCKVLEGFYNIEDGLFETPNDEQILSYQSEDFIPSENEYCVGNYVTDSLLKRVYAQENVDIALMIFQTEMMDNAIIMYYDVEKEEFDMTTLNLKNVEPFDYMGNKIEVGKPTFVSSDQIGDTDEEQQAYLDNFFESARQALGLPEGETFTILSIEEIDDLLSLNSKEEFVSTLTDIMSKKDEFISKLQNPEGYFTTIADISLKLLLDHETLEEMQEQLQAYYRVYADNAEELEKLRDDEFDATSEVDDLDYDGLIRSREVFLDTILSTNTIESMYKILSVIRKGMAVSLERLKEDEEQSRMQTAKYYFIRLIEKIDELLELDDLEEIKNRYVEFHYETEDLYKEVVNELIDTDEYASDYIKKHEELSKVYEELFANLEDKSYIIDYKTVRERMVSRIIGRNSQIDTILTVIDDNDKLSNGSKKKSIIIAGSTGTGKTQTFLELKRILSDVRPVYITDTNQITQVGYQGGTIEENILLPLIMEAHEINNRKNNRVGSSIQQDDIELAQHGIVFLDEIDKRASKGSGETNVNESGVIVQLLKLMDPGTKYTVRIGNKVIQFDTTNLIVLSGGAFQEYFDKVRENKPKPGFNTETVTETTESTKLFKYNEVDSEVLVQYGLDRQYIARHSKAVLYQPHTKESLVELENNMNTSNLQVLKDKYGHDKITFLWEDGYIERVAEEAVKTGNGGRALVNIIERSLGNLSPEVKKRRDEFKAILVPVSAVEDSGTIRLVRHDNTTTTLAELVEETRLEDERSKKLTQITRDEDMYEEVMKLFQDSKVKTIGEMPRK